jgi:hypothetical protein
MSSTSSASLLSASDWLTLAVVRAAKAAHAPTPELRDAVHNYVDELKVRGFRPEQVLVALKTLVSEAGVRRAGPRLDASIGVRPDDEIIEHVVAWCIEAYFQPQVETNSPA